MNKFKSKTNISDYVIRLKLKRCTVFPVTESLKCLLLNEPNQSKTNVIGLCNPYETEVQSFLYLSSLYVVTSPRHTHTKKKKKIKIHIFFFYARRPTMRNWPHKNSAIWSDIALFIREDHFCNLFLPTLVNMLFLHKPVRLSKMWKLLSTFCQ